MSNITWSSGSHVLNEQTSPIFSLSIIKLRLKNQKPQLRSYRSVNSVVRTHSFKVEKVLDLGTMVSFLQNVFSSICGCCFCFLTFS